MALLVLAFFGSKFVLELVLQAALSHRASSDRRSIAFTIFALTTIARAWIMRAP